MFACVEHEDVKTEGASRNWMKDLIHLIDFNHGLFDDLLSEGMIDYERRLEDLKAMSSVFDQRDRLLDLMAKQSSTDLTQFLDALRSTGQEHVANFITRNGCEYSSIYLFICVSIIVESYIMLSTISHYYVHAIVTLQNKNDMKRN